MSSKILIFYTFSYQDSTFSLEEYKIYTRKTLILHFKTKYETSYTYKYKAVRRVRGRCFLALRGRTDETQTVASLFLDVKQNRKHLNDVFSFN